MNHSDRTFERCSNWTSITIPEHFDNAVDTFIDEAAAEAYAKAQVEALLPQTLGMPLKKAEKQLSGGSSTFDSYYNHLIVLCMTKSNFCPAC